MNAHPLIRDMKILQISLAVEDFAPYSPWWLETGLWGGTLMHMSLSPPPPPFSLRGQLYRQYSAAALRSRFLHRIPCNTYSPHCRYKKNTLEVWATGIKGQTSKSMAKQVHL